MVFLKKKNATGTLASGACSIQRWELIRYTRSTAHETGAAQARGAEQEPPRGGGAQPGGASPPLAERGERGRATGGGAQRPRGGVSKRRRGGWDCLRASGQKHR